MKKHILLVPLVCVIGVFISDFFIKWVISFEISPQVFFVSLMGIFILILLGIIFYALLVKALEDWRYLIGISMSTALLIDCWFGIVPSAVSCLVISGILSFLYEGE